MSIFLQRVFEKPHYSAFPALCSIFKTEQITSSLISGIRMPKAQSKMPRQQTQKELPAMKIRLYKWHYLKQYKEKMLPKSML